MGDFPDWSLSQQVLIDNVLVASGAFTVAYDVTRYNTVYVRVTGVGGTGLAALDYRQFGPTGDVIDSGLLSNDQALTAATWAIPVIGSTILFTNFTGGSINVELTGTAAQLPKSMLGQYNPADVRAVSVPNGTASGAFTRLLTSLSVGSSGLGNVTAFGGQIALRWAIGSLGAATQWNLYAAFPESDGTRVFAPVTEVNAIGNKEFEWGHPWAFTSWYVQNTGVLTSPSSHSLSIFPA